MTTAATAASAKIGLTPIQLCWQYILSCLGLFSTGLLVGYIPIAHYMHGALAGDVGPVFLRNMTLWWGCPALLAEHTVQSGSLAMMAIGFTYLALRPQGGTATPTRHEQLAPALCKWAWWATCMTNSPATVVRARSWDPSSRRSPRSARSQAMCSASAVCRPMRTCAAIGNSGPKIAYKVMHSSPRSVFHWASPAGSFVWRKRKARGTQRRNAIINLRS